MFKLVRASDPDHHMDDLPPSKNPGLAIIREIDFKIVEDDDGDMIDFYYSGYTDDVLITGSTTLTRLLKTVASPRFKFPYGPSVPGDPYSNSLSLNSKRELSYIIFKLAKKGWMYSYLNPPFKIGDDGNTAGVYYDARRVTDNLAYFVSDGAAMPAGVDYAHAFNIYLELLIPDGDPVPVRIDPDVRHPGGSGD